MNIRENPGSIVNKTLSTQVDSEGNIPTAPSGLYVPLNWGRSSDGAFISTSTSGNGDAGNLTVTATDVELIGAGSSLVTSVNSEATGNGGSLTIDTQRLRVQDGAFISTGTFGNGNAGNLTITATDVEVIGTTVDGQTFSGLFASANQGSSARSGNITIKTDRLLVQEGAGIEVTTQSKDGGNITVTATKLVELSGTAADGTSGGLAAATFGTGDAGSVRIETGQLVIRDGAGLAVGTLGEGQAGEIEILASDSVELSGTTSDGASGGLAAGTLGTGDAGSVRIETGQLVIRDGAILVVRTENEGQAGEIEILASDSVEISNAGGTEGTLMAETEGTGNAGTVSITTEQLTVRDGAIVSVLSTSSGLPGNINISANEILLDSQAQLNAGSEAGQGGNIRLESNDIRLLNGSEIIATGSESGQTFEGNIEIDADLLVLLQGSRIVTDAFSPSGGSNINIQPFNNSNIVIVQSSDSVINAAGNLTIDSSVTFQPAEIPEVAVTNPNDLIAQEFCRQRGESTFVVTGRGGIAVSPNDKSDGNQINVDLVEPVPSRPRNTSQKRSETEDNQPISSLDLVPARGWIRDENGDVILVSYDPTKTGTNRQPTQLPQCQP